MTDFKEIVEELQSLFETLNLDEDSLNEKIMSKKQARILRKKKRAALKKKQQAQQNQQETPQESDVLDAEIVDDGGDNNNDNDEKDNNEEPSQGTALIVYQEPNNEDDYDTISDEFKKLGEIITPLLENYKNNIIKASKLWEQNGKNKACPQEAWDLMNKSIIELKEGYEQALNSVNLDNLYEPEVLILDRFSTGINGYIEKAQQEITAIKPNLTEDDFKAPATTNSTEVTTTMDSKGTALTTTDNQNDVEPKDIEVSADKSKKDKNKRTKTNIIDYERFMKGFKPLNSSFQELSNGWSKVVEAIVKGIAKTIGALALQPVSWLNDKIFGFLTSPIANDFVKTLMYSNPLTAMIFDGKFGNFGITGVLDKTHALAKKFIDKGKAATNPFKKGEKLEKLLNERGFVKDVSKLTLKELKWATYGNKDFCNCINVCFNHADVRNDDKAILRKTCITMKRAFATKQIEVVRKCITTLTTTLNKICDYMNWVTPKDWNKLVKKVMGNTDKDLKKIDSKNKPKTKNTDKEDMQKAIRNYLKVNKDLSNQEIEKFLKEENPTLSQRSIDTYLNDLVTVEKERLNKLTTQEESLRAHISKLERLLEQAEA